jgi:hypothetical protein
MFASTLLFCSFSRKTFTVEFMGETFRVYFLVFFEGSVTVVIVGVQKRDDERRQRIKEVSTKKCYHQMREEGCCYSMRERASQKGVKHSSVHHKHPQLKEKGVNNFGVVNSHASAITDESFTPSCKREAFKFLCLKINDFATDFMFGCKDLMRVQSQ